jgi:hypothetical protein
MERSARQRKQLSVLCEEWAGSSGMVLPPLLVVSRLASMGIMIKEDPRAQELMCCGSCCDREMGCTSCGGIGRSLREVKSMHKAFGSMLYSLASYDEVCMEEITVEIACQQCWLVSLIPTCVFSSIVTPAHSLLSAGSH